MNSVTDHQIFQLGWDSRFNQHSDRRRFDHLNDPPRLIKRMVSNRFHLENWSQPITPGEPPAPLIFTGSVQKITKVDFPSNDANQLIMSRRTYDALVSVGDFAHRVRPVLIVEQGITLAEAVNPNGTVKDKYLLLDYITLELTTTLDLLDPVRSTIVTLNSDVPPERNWSYYVFKSVSKPLPPLFKIPEDPNVTFITAQARQVLARRQISGIKYIVAKNLDRTSSEEYVDTPALIDWQTEPRPRRI